jgi:hypothetical protein
MDDSVAASFFPSELGVRGTMRLPNRKEELARGQRSSSADLVHYGVVKPEAEDYSGEEQGEGLRFTQNRQTRK